MVLPFVQVAGRWHVVVNWEPGMKPDRNLELRPLTDRESSWLEQELENAVMDVWARLFSNDNAIKYGTEPPEDDVGTQ